jgi:hypothetical protein
VARAAIALGAVLVVAGGGALGFALTRRGGAEVTPEASAAMASAVGKLDGDLRVARAKVEERARALFERQEIARPLGTDAVTAMDMVGQELKLNFDAAKDEIELVQVPKDRGKPETLIALPDTARRLTRAPGPGAELSGEELLVSYTFALEPSSPDKKGLYTGYITARRKVDLGPAFEMLRRAGVAGSFELGGKAAAIGPLPDGARTETKPLPSEQDARLVMAAAVEAGGAPMPLVAGGAAAAALGLVLIAIGVLAGRKPPAPAVQPSILAMPTVESLPPGGAHGSTKLSGYPGVAAAGTPSPGDPNAAAIDPRNLGPGALIGRWEVVRRLGSGGMADVYLAQSKGEAGFEKLVAIKVMHGHLARNQRAVDHFLDEARLAARIHHPNVVGIQDLGKIGNDYVIVMDYVEGVDLERLLASARAAQRPVPVDVALGVLVRICDGLHAAHTATGPDGTPLGIIHRDVKSANVLVSRQGGVKVVDFGIAKAATQVHYTVAGETKGTPSMMAPEQRVGEVVDVRADVYSVAAVGYELVTGHAVNLDLAALAHLGVENWPHLPLPSSLRASLPQELDELLLGAMAFEREKRPADCAELGASFEAVMKRHGLSASDKDIARWAESELRQLVPAFQGFSTLASKPVIG